MGCGKSQEKGYSASCEMGLLLLGKGKTSFSVFTEGFHAREMPQSDFIVI